MMLTNLHYKKNSNVTYILFVAMVIFKLAIEIGYYWLLTYDKITYPLDFNPLKYVNGLLWCIILFFCIDHRAKKVSVFMLYMVFLFQIIPITCVFAFANCSLLYFNVLCFSFLICEIIVCHTNSIKVTLTSKTIWVLLSLFFVFCTIFLYIIAIKQNGRPSLTALNIYKVYEMRKSGSFSLGKVGNYLLQWSMGIIVPFFLAYLIDKKHYFLSLILCLGIFLIYLYSGHKAYLFCIPMIIVCSIWSRRRAVYKELFVTFCFLFLILVLLSLKSNSISEIYSLIGRRCFMVPAVNKFNYYDFFSSHEHLGFAGLLPRWIINIHNPYENQVIGKIIAAKYYNSPEMNSNTGFFAEGYTRFGIIGIPFILTVFAYILKLMDKFQERANYSLAITIFVYPVFCLADGELLSSLFFGSWMISLLIMIFFNKPILNNPFKKVIIT